MGNNNSIVEVDFKNCFYYSSHQCVMLLIASRFRPVFRSDVKVIPICYLIETNDTRMKLVRQELNPRGLMSDELTKDISRPEHCYERVSKEYKNKIAINTCLHRPHSRRSIDGECSPSASNQSNAPD